MSSNQNNNNLDRVVRVRGSRVRTPSPWSRVSATATDPFIDERSSITFTGSCCSVHTPSYYPTEKCRGPPRLLPQVPVKSTVKKSLSELVREKIEAEGSLEPTETEAEATADLPSTVVIPRKVVVPRTVVIPRTVVVPRARHDRPAPPSNKIGHQAFTPAQLVIVEALIAREEEEMRQTRQVYGAWGLKAQDELREAELPTMEAEKARGIVSWASNVVTPAPAPSPAPEPRKRNKSLAEVLADTRARELAQIQEREEQRRQLASQEQQAPELPVPVKRTFDERLASLRERLADTRARELAQIQEREEQRRQLASQEQLASELRKRTFDERLASLRERLMDTRARELAQIQEREEQRRQLASQEQQASELLQRTIDERLASLRERMADTRARELAQTDPLVPELCEREEQRRQPASQEQRASELPAPITSERTRAQYVADVERANQFRSNRRMSTWADLDRYLARQRELAPVLCEPLASVPACGESDISISASIPADLAAECAPVLPCEPLTSVASCGESDTSISVSIPADLAAECAPVLLPYGRLTSVATRGESDTSISASIPTDLAVECEPVLDCEPLTPVPASGDSDISISAIIPVDLATECDNIELEPEQESEQSSPSIFDTLKVWVVNTWASAKKMIWR
ncbi:hypothetical protein LTR08_000282 [Meristemomyces frigidus]|nr:hypothetical protein LTR08_000282 [Meristemomyces frigidus]